MPSPHVPRLGWALAAAFVALPACSHAASVSSPGPGGEHALREPAPSPASLAPTTTLDAEVVADVDAGAPVAAPEVPAAWRDAVREGRLEDAVEPLDRALSLAPGDAELRLVRARVATRLGDGARALAWLEGLERDLPVLGATLARYRDDARALGRRSPRADDEPPPAAVTREGRLARARRLASSGRTDAALAELDAIAPRARADDALLRERAQVLYQARDRYLDAAAAFDLLAARGGALAAEAAFHAARARSRADHDDDAARGYRRVVARYPRSRWSDEASYLLARLPWLHGRWREAAQGYDEYLRRAPSGRFRAEATYERAVAHLAGGDAGLARTAFAALARAATAPLERARLGELEAASALRAGDREGALARFASVALEAPLGWPALAARARIAQLGGAAPALLAAGDGATADPLAAELPAAAALLHRLGLDDDAEAWLAGHEREVTVASARRAEALCALYGALDRGARRYRVGIDAVPAPWLSRAPSPASAWAWACVYPRPFGAQVSAAEASAGLPAGLVHAVMRRESAFDPSVVSPARAVGLLQLMPDTARRMAKEAAVPFASVDRLARPGLNVTLGARYLAKLLGTFHGSVPVAAAAYNAGPRAVARWLARADGLPLDVWVAAIPYAETRAYVAHVVGNWARYAYLEGGDAAVPTLALELPGDAHVTEGDF